MVGFGSSLRISRRRGWERAYLNYESLKLLLTQIEAAYEECEAEADNNAPPAGTDYRDELFLASDSDGAFGLSDYSSCRSSSSSISSWDDSQECSFDDDDEAAPGGGGGEQFHGNFFVVMGGGGGGAFPDAPSSAGVGGNGQKRKRSGILAKLGSRCPVQFGTGSPLAKSSSEDTADNTTGTNFTGGTRRGGNVGGYDFTPQSNRIRMAWDVPNSAGFFPEHELIYDRQESPDDGNNGGVPRQPLFDAGAGGYGSTPIGQHPVDVGGGAGGADRYRPDHNDFEKVALLPSAASTNAGANGTLHVKAGSNSGWSSWLQSPEPQQHHHHHRQEQSGHFESAHHTAGETLATNVEQGAVVDVPNQQRFAVNASGALLSSAKQRRKKKKNRKRASKYDVFRGQRGWNFGEPDPLQGGRCGVGAFANAADSRGMIYQNWGENTYSGAVVQGEEGGVSMHQNQHRRQRGSGGKRRKTSRYSCCSRKRRSGRPRWRSCRRGRKNEAKPSSSTPPQHLRTAHEKARAITGRFLGLLRAETEKVQLFAYARMGELSDTLGSLRFMEDQHHHHRTSNGNFDYDDMSEPSAGMHPSASSSSDEGGDVGATGFLGDVGPSFSSIEDRERSRHVRAHVRGRQHVHRSPQRQQQQQKGWRRRRNRPIFQRSEQVIGEDSALLAAVDEADAYLAVAVELLHLIRFICVNAVAVRKIVKKHDKLLSNRMLGGYYHRERRRRQRVVLASSKRRQRNQRCPSEKYECSIYTCGTKSKKNNRTVGSKVKLRGSAKTICPREEIGSKRQHHVSPDLILQATQNSQQSFPILDSDRLLGTQDAQIQKLVDCPQIETISASLAAILSEYEVSQSRADAFSRLQTSTSMDSEADYVAKVQGGFPSPAVRGRENSVVAGQGNEDDVSQTTSYSDGDGPPSTSSSISLMRLRYAVISILKFRQAARIRVRPLDAALSRHAMTYTGQNAVGESLNGSSREILNVLLGYNAASALVLDTDTLYDALMHGENAVFFASTEIKWWQDSDVNIFDDDHKSRTNCVERCFCFSAQHRMVSSLMADRSHKQSNIKPATLLLNLCAAFLYTVSEGSAEKTSHWFIEDFRTQAKWSMSTSSITLTLIHKTHLFPFGCNTYKFGAAPLVYRHIIDVEQMGSNASMSAILIGAASFGAIGAACAHTYWSFCTNNWSRYELAFILCSLCGIAGNLMLALSSIFKSLALAFFGRIVIGFASSDVLNRRLISCCMLRGGFVRESSKIVSVHAIAIFCGTLLAAVACSAPEDVMQEAVMSTIPVQLSLSQSFNQTPSNVVQSSSSLITESAGQDTIHTAQTTLHHDKSLLVLEVLSFIMSFLWLLLLLALLCAFQEPVEIRQFIGGGQLALHRYLDQYEQQPQEEAVTEDFDSDTSNCQDHVDTGMSIHRDSSCGTNLKSTYGTSHDGEEQTHLLNSRSSYMSTDNNSIPDGRPETKKRWAWLSHALRIRALVCHNITLPVTLAILSLAEFTIEIIFSSCAMVTHRYFGWNESMAGVMLSCLGMATLPICHIFSFVISRRDERSVMKYSAVVMGVGMGILLNYEALYSSLVHVRSLLQHDEDYGRAFHPYDWVFGVYQYVLGVVVIFASSLTLRGASLSLMSKVAPNKLNYTAVNCALLVTIIGAFARVIADSMITLVGLSHLRVNTDMINSLFLPLMFFCFAGFYLIKKHYFFLI